MKYMTAEPFRIKMVEPITASNGFRKPDTMHSA